MVLLSQWRFQKLGADSQGKASNRCKKYASFIYVIVLLESNVIYGYNGTGVSSSKNWPSSGIGYGTVITYVRRVIMSEFDAFLEVEQ